MTDKVVLKPGWYLVETASPHALVRDDDGDVARFDEFEGAEAFRDANVQNKHDVAFLFVPLDNMGWGE